MALGGDERSPGRFVVEESGASFCWAADGRRRGECRSYLIADM